MIRILIMIQSTTIRTIRISSSIVIKVVMSKRNGTNKFTMALADHFHYTAAHCTMKRPIPRLHLQKNPRILELVRIAGNPVLHRIHPISERQN